MDVFREGAYVETKRAGACLCDVALVTEGGRADVVAMAAVTRHEAEDPVLCWRLSRNEYRAVRHPFYSPLP